MATTQKALHQNDRWLVIIEKCVYMLCIAYLALRDKNHANGPSYTSSSEHSAKSTLPSHASSCWFDSTLIQWIVECYIRMERGYPLQLPTPIPIRTPISKWDQISEASLCIFARKFSSLFLRFAYLYRIVVREGPAFRYLYQLAHLQYVIIVDSEAVVRWGWVRKL